jgi:LmbE family N-acetylglucosaminyl deacetylase
MERKQVAVLSPHTDDETLCCGGTIAKYVEAGHDVYVYAFSCGTSNETEFTKACAALGATGRPFTHFKTRQLSEKRQSVLDILVEIKKQINPEVVLLPASDDCHQDHQVIHREGVRAFKHSTIYGYEAPWNSFTFKNHAYNVLSADHVTTKVAAMQEYSSQFVRSTFKEEVIISLARVRGMQVNTEYAECFEVIRQFI